MAGLKLEGTPFASELVQTLSKGAATVAALEIDTRRVAIMKTAGAASPSLWVWTSSQSKILPATYDASTARVSAELAAWDPLLDAMAFSRGRIGVSSSGLAALVAPPWGEVGRVVEDCRV